ncbi:MAG: hypothetical protein GY906_23290 [bacterium]|nr:hypothetical protein [bacterium]
MTAYTRAFPEAGLPAVAADVAAPQGTPVAIAITYDASINTDWTYSATAADNPDAGAGDLDGQPGLIFNGPDGGVAAVVSFTDLTIDPGTAAPDAADRYTLSVYKNSELVAQADEGFLAVAGPVTFSLVGTYVQVQKDDAVRFAITGREANTAAKQLDIQAAGALQLK